MRHALAPLLASALLGTGCGDAAETESAPPQNDPPAWTDAPPAAVALGQGRSTVLPTTVVDPEGDPTLLTATAASGLEAEVVVEPPSIALHALYSAAGPTSLDVSLDDGRGGLANVPVVVDVQPLRWHERQTWTGADGPEAREHGALLVDEPGGRVLLVGGSGYAPYMTPLDDVWQYDVASGAWTELAPAGTPPPGGGSRRVAAIPGERVAYLFGGYGANGANHNELWRVTFDGADPVFEPVDQQGTPAKRALHAFVYDAPTDRFVMFGGAGYKPWGDTWTMRLEGGVAVWTELALPVAPSPRYGFFYGHDVERRRLVVYSGAQGFDPLDPARDVWVLDLQNEPPSWQLVLDGEAAGVPPGRRNGCAVFDPTGPRLFVFGGTPDAKTSAEGLFALDARPGKESFAELVLDGAPPIRSSGFGFYDAAGGRVMLGFGNTSTAVFRDWAALGY